MTKRNVIFSFSIPIRNRIDKMIEDNIGNTVISKTIRKEYSKDVKTLSPQTIQAYRHYIQHGNTEMIPVRKQEEQLEKDLAEIQKEQSELEASFVLDKSAYIDVLRLKIDRRITILDELNKRSMGRVDIKLWNLYQRYIDCAKDLVLTKAKVSGEMKDETNLVVNIMQSEFASFLKIAHDTVKEVCPEKLLDFKDVFSRKYKEMRGENNSEIIEAEKVN